LSEETIMSPLFGFFEGALSPSHIIVVLVVGFLLFGRRLPEMGRSLGKGIVEFKKGLKGLEDEVDPTPPVRHEATAEPIRPPQRVGTAAPKFDEGARAVTAPPTV
jgi:sec-independent protein translocase protein TatA